LCKRKGVQKSAVLNKPKKTKKRGKKKNKVTRRRKGKSSKESGEFASRVRVLKGKQNFSERFGIAKRRRPRKSQ